MQASIYPRKLSRTANFSIPAMVISADLNGQPGTLPGADMLRRQHFRQCAQLSRDDQMVVAIV